MPILYTIGHGSRDVDELVAMLEDADVRLVVDARGTPRSRRFPQFGYGPLGARLEAKGIAYDWRRVLGGMRRAPERPRHPGLSEPSLQAFAEHMESDEFRVAAERLAAEAVSETVCVLCAERDPTRCHRSLIADWFVARGRRVVHLLAPGRSCKHALHAAARLDSGRLCYLGGGLQRALF
jgi:uncharacterized protein (DUF488 family)